MVYAYIYIVSLSQYNYFFKEDFLLMAQIWTRFKIIFKKNIISQTNAIKVADILN